MRINVKVIPNASRSEIINCSDGEYRIKVPVAPENGKANKAVVQLLAKYFQLPKNRIKIIAGEKSHQKVIELFDLPNKIP